MWKEFKEFALKGSVIDLAIGIVIGAAFGTIVKSLVDDILMPPIGLLLGNVDFTDMFLVLREGSPAAPYATLEAARSAGAVTWNYGLFANTIVAFLIVTFAIFLVVRMINRWRAQAPVETNTRTCPRCLSTIPLGASRCAFCTSELSAARS